MFDRANKFWGKYSAGSTDRQRSHGRDIIADTQDMEASVEELMDCFGDDYKTSNTRTSMT